MLSYEQIKTAERDLYSTLSELQSIINSNSFKQIFDVAGQYESEKFMPADFLRAEHDKLIARLYTYFINRIPRLDAQKMILDEFKYKKPIIAARLVDMIYIQQNNRMRSQNIYAAHMMKKAGVTNKKIAAVLQVTSTTVAKYLKTSLKIKN